MATDNSETSLQWRAWLDSEKVLNLTQCDTVLQNSEQSIEPKFRSTSRRFMQFLCKQQLTNTPAYTRFHCCVELSCLINNNCSITRGIQEVQPPVDWPRRLTCCLLLILCTQAQHLHGTAHLHISAACSTYTTATLALERMMKCQQEHHITSLFWRYCTYAPEVHRYDKGDSFWQGTDQYALVSLLVGTSLKFCPHIHYTDSQSILLGSQPNRMDWESV